MKLGQLHTFFRTYFFLFVFLENVTILQMLLTKTCLVTLYLDPYAVLRECRLRKNLDYNTKALRTIERYKYKDALRKETEIARRLQIELTKERNRRLEEQEQLSRRTTGVSLDIEWS